LRKGNRLHRRPLAQVGPRGLPITPGRPNHVGDHGRPYTGYPVPTAI
jgi:hypothetical protein